jgi:hypothetical protein
VSEISLLSRTCHTWITLSAAYARKTEKENQINSVILLLTQGRWCGRENKKEREKKEVSKKERRKAKKSLPDPKKSEQQQ